MHSTRTDPTQRSTNVGKVGGKCLFHLDQGTSGKVREACNGQGKIALV